MAFIDTSELETTERKPGWHGRYFDSPSMTFAHYAFEKGSEIHEHSHPQEEVWQVVQGKLRITIDGMTKVAGPGFVGIVPPNARHSVIALSDGKAIVTDFPRREL
jgi:quercetin dioxygenase-like cupin family protein